MIKPKLTRKNSRLALGCLTNILLLPTLLLAQDDPNTSQTPVCLSKLEQTVIVSQQSYSCSRCIDDTSISNISHETLDVRIYRQDWPVIPLHMVLMTNTGPEKQNDWSASRAERMLSDANKFTARMNCAFQVDADVLARLDTPSTLQDINLPAEYETIRNNLVLFQPTIVLGGLFSAVSSNPRHAVTEYESGITFMNKYNHDPGLGILLVHELIHSFLKVPNSEHSQSRNSIFKAYLDLRDNSTNIGIEQAYCKGLADYATQFASRFAASNAQCRIVPSQQVE